MVLWAPLTVFGLFTLFRLALGAITVNTPSNVRECEMYTLSWSDPSANGPYQIAVFPVGGPASEYANLTLWLKNVTPTSVAWRPNRPSGSKLAVHVKDKDGVIADSDSFIMASGDTTSCIYPFTDYPTTSSTDAPQTVVTTMTNAAQTTIVTTTNQDQATTATSSPTGEQTSSAAVASSSPGSLASNSQSTSNLSGAASMTAGGSSSSGSFASGSQSTSDLFGSPTATSAASSSSSKMSTGTIVGFAIGALAALALIATIIFLLKRKRRADHSLGIDAYGAEKGSPPQPLSGPPSQTSISPFPYLSPISESAASPSPLTGQFSPRSKFSYPFTANAPQSPLQTPVQMAPMGQGMSYTPVDSTLTNTAPPGYSLNP